MNIVIVGDESLKLNAVLSELQHVAGQQVVLFNPAYLVEPKARHNRLKMEISRCTFRNTIKVFTGLNYATEIELLRQEGALIAHIYGELGRVYNDIKIQPGDKFVLSSRGHYRRPPHVYTPEQLLSECLVSHARKKVS